MIPFTSQDIINQTNQYRIEQHLPELKTNPMLMKAAQERAADMGVTGDFSHSVATTSPLKNHAAFIDKSGYKRTYSGENLAVDFNTATDTMQAWKDSPTHNKNLTSKNYLDTGVAIVPRTENGKTTYYTIQLFGTQAQSEKKKVTVPKSAKIQTSDGFMYMGPNKMPISEQSFTMSKSTPKTRYTNK